MDSNNMPTQREQHTGKARARRRRTL